MKTSSAPPQPIRSEEYEVYAAVLSQKFADKKRRIYVINNITMARTAPHTGEILESISERQDLSWLAPEAAKDFEKQNEQRSILEPCLNLPKPYKLLSEAENREIWSISAPKPPSRTCTDGWDYFEELYPDALGYFLFSRVGLSQDASQAIVEVGRQWHWRAGRGELLILRRAEGNWIVAQEAETWIS